MKKYFLITGLLIFSFFQLHSNEIDSLDLPEMIGASNSGTLFYLTFHPAWETNSEGEAIRIYISSKYATKVNLEIEGLKLFKTKMTIPNDVIEFTLQSEKGHPYTKTDLVPPLPEQIFAKRAIKITSDDPIICYGVARYYASSDGYMALPVNCLGTDYQVSSNADPSNNIGQWLPSYTSIVGAYDNTVVTFRLGGFESSMALKENGDSLKTGESITRVINKGDVWIIPGIGPFNDLTGSTIKADKPVAVISGNFCAFVPNTTAACDYLIEQELPIYNWGKKYLVSPVKSRKSYSIIKIFAAEDNTNIYNNGVLIGTIKTAGGQTGSGFLEMRAGEAKKDEMPKPVIISGDKPINVVQYNTGSQDDGVESDPFQMQVLPEEQFMTDVIFNTPGINGGYGFKNNFINIIYKATPDGKIPDSLMWAEVIDGKYKWIPLKEYNDNPGLKFYETDSPNRYFFSKSMVLSHDGVYRIKSSDPVAVYCYGSDYYDSYGFPASGRLRDMTTDDIMVPDVSYEIDDYGNISGIIEDKDGNPGIVNKNVEAFQGKSKASGISVVSMIKSLSENYKFTTEDFIAGKDNSVSFKAEIIDKTKPSKAVITISDRCGNDSVLVLSIKPKTYPEIMGIKKNFGILKSSELSEINFTLENKSEFPTYSIKQIVLENNDPQFEIINNINKTIILKKGENHSFSLKFKPKELNTSDISLSDGIFNNHIGFELETGEIVYSFDIKAEVANPQIEVKDVNFSTKNFGETYKQEFLYIYNKGKTPLEISGFEFPANSPFKFTLPDVSLEKPLIIKPNGEFYIRTNFEPTEPGEYSATLKVISDGFPLKNESKITGAVLATSVNEDIILNSDISVKYSDGKITFDSKLDYLINNIEICDINGRIIHSGQINESIKNYSLSLPGLVKGIYMVKFTINNITLNRKIII